MTNSYYFDITEHSPSKRYRVEAKSPCNAGERRKAFQRDFVYTFTDHLAFNPDGEMTTWIYLLDEAMTGEEKQKYVRRTSAGPKWAGLSHWYFAEIANRKGYVIRPWWGRRMFFNLEAGELFEVEDELIGNAVEMETKYAMATLEKFTSTDHELVQRCHQPSYRLISEE